MFIIIIVISFIVTVVKFPLSQIIFDYFIILSQ